MLKLLRQFQNLDVCLMTPNNFLLFEYKSSGNNHKNTGMTLGLSIRSTLAIFRHFDLTISFTVIE